MKKKYSILSAPLLKTVLRPLALFALLLPAQIVSAVTFTVSPATVSNTYSGIITLQIGGLTSGESVVVQKFTDLNANGVIDTTDWLAQQFNLTDGQPGMVIGGVTNLNVPGDMDTTAGQITARLNFHTGDFAQTVAGNYLLKLSSPTGRFSAIPLAFNVTAFPYAQKITGTVVCNGANVPNAVVLLFLPSRGGNQGPGSPQVGAVANSAGLYSIPAPAGTYLPVAFKNNYLVSFAAVPVVTLNSGATSTANLTLTSATASISGRLVEAGNASLGLPGMLLSARSADGSMGIGFTDATGNFALGVKPGQWFVGADDASLVSHGCLRLQDETAVNAGATGVTLAVPKATALVYGSVQDSLGKPMTGIDIWAADNNGQYQTDGYTDANGNYFAGVVGGLVNDPWRLQISNDTGPSNYLFSQPAFNQNGGTNLAVGQAVHLNFSALLAPQRISGHVQAYGTNLAGVGVYAYAMINGASYNPYIDTDKNGNYSLNVANGSWSVGLSYSGGSDSLDRLLGGDSRLWPGNQMVTINNLDATVNFTIPASQVPPLQVTTTSLPAGTNGLFYSQNLQASGGQTPYTWSLIPYSASLPPNLSLSSGGLLSGTPATNGTFFILPRVTDATGKYADVASALTLTLVNSPLRITTATLPNGTMGSTYSAALQAAGGQPPYRWQLLLGSASLPPGLSLSSAGIISGAPTNSGTFNFIVQAYDSVSSSAIQPLAIVVSPPAVVAPTITSQPQSLTVTNGNSASFSVTATGTPPLSYQWQFYGPTSPGRPTLSCSWPM